MLSVSHFPNGKNEMPGWQTKIIHSRSQQGMQARRITRPSVLAIYSSLDKGRQDLGFPSGWSWIMILLFSLKEPSWWVICFRAKQSNILTLEQHLSLWIFFFPYHTLNLGSPFLKTLVSLPSFLNPSTTHPKVLILTVPSYFLRVLEGYKGLFLWMQQRRPAILISSQQGTGESAPVDTSKSMHGRLRDAGTLSERLCFLFADGAYGLMFLSDFSGLIQLKTLLIPQMLLEALLILKDITLLLWTIADNHCQLLMNYLRVWSHHTTPTHTRSHLDTSVFCAYSLSHLMQRWR